jgi:adenylate cyclase
MDAVAQPFQQMRRGYVGDTKSGPTPPLCSGCTRARSHRFTPEADFPMTREAVTMPVEIERKFLVLADGWRAAVTHREWQRQGYVSKTPRGTVRVRLCASHATITVKGVRKGCVRHEFEYAIPSDHADDILCHLCVKPLIEKVRHLVTHAGVTWQVDEYYGAGAGLVLAEIELERPDQPLVLPKWVGGEVTHDVRYRNSAIARGAWRKTGNGLARPIQDPSARALAPLESRQSRGQPKRQQAGVYQIHVDTG